MDRGRGEYEQRRGRIGTRGGGKKGCGGANTDKGGRGKKGCGGANRDKGGRSKKGCGGANGDLGEANRDKNV